jgi:hypothetical protein
MKPVLKALAVAVAFAASHSALSNDSPFPSYGEAIDRALPPAGTYADRHAANGSSAGSSGSPFPASAEAIDVALPPLDTYADRHARNGTLWAGSASPFPGAADVFNQPALDTYADRHARENAAPTSADVDAAKLAVRANGQS